MTSGLAWGAAACAATAVALAGLVAVTVTLTGSTDDARHLLDLPFTGVDGAAATGIWFQNARLAAAALVLAAARPWLSRSARLVADGLLGVLLAANAAIVGVALGAYGSRVVAPHLPLELAGLSIAGGAYVSAASRPMPAVALVLAGAFSAVLLVLAAVAETGSLP